MEFDEFFKKAMGTNPYAYQTRLATEDSLPELVDIPTGLGKTAAVVLAWLWRRRFHEKPSIRFATPRRLVYCLPMRVLVEQTHNQAICWLDKLGMLAGEIECDDPAAGNPRIYRPERKCDPAGWASKKGIDGPPIAVHLLMGGEERTDWALWPERDAILIGTQDMLLSRALNRGYAASRARWPMEFGLLNNDCLWVFDEVQLMGSGLATTAQLNAFRNGGKAASGFGTVGRCQCLWMSATAEPGWLDTVDHQVRDDRYLTLSQEEKDPPEDIDTTSPLAGLSRRIHATKMLRKANSVWDKKPTALAQEILDDHIRVTQNSGNPALSLVVVNVVDRALALYEAVAGLLKPPKKAKKAAAAPASDAASEPATILLHSRFRMPDRRRLVDKLLLAQSVIDARLQTQTAPQPADPEFAAFAAQVAQHGVIVISTQVVEAGVDISARILFAELAPWASLVQRFGRCNRRGEYDAADVRWIEIGAEDPKAALPYDKDELDEARRHLQALDGKSVGPRKLTRYRESAGIALPYRPLHVIRRKDVVELFDTTPDLAGNDLDISRYIREADEHDVQVFWRALPDDLRPAKQTPAARPEELCPVPVGKLREFLENNKGRIWRWNFLDSQWEKAMREHVYPGQMFLIACDVGGYSDVAGWQGELKDFVSEIPIVAAAPDGMNREPLSQIGVWQGIDAHTDEVYDELEEILAAFPDDIPRETLLLAARWHDRGKAHPCFQALIKAERRSAIAARSVVSAFVAKAPKDCWRQDRIKPLSSRVDGNDDLRRRHFRHELASALAVLQLDPGEIPEAARDLAVYLVAAHHGKVRLSIRSLPDEFRPPEEGRLFARGIWHDDTMPPTDLGAGVTAPEAKLNLDPMQLGKSKNGQPSWVERMLKLRDRLGIYRLAFLEALLRAADCRASIKADAQRRTNNG
ncbi:MAG: type I-G CRISPR-associated helicase/endonuclease Cas3g [Acidobacteriota bacterium]